MRAVEAMGRVTFDCCFMRHGRYEHNIYSAELPVGSVALQQCSSEERKAPARAVAESAGCGPRVFGTVKNIDSKRETKEGEKKEREKIGDFIFCIDGFMLFEIWPFNYFIFTLFFFFTLQPCVFSYYGNC